MISRYAGLVGLLLFLSILAVADWSLRRWGSAAMRGKPRSGGRITILFLGLCLVCGLLELVASRLWPYSPALAVLIVVAQFPVSVGVVVGLDHVLPGASSADT